MQDGKGYMNPQCQAAIWKWNFTIRYHHKCLIGKSSDLFVPLGSENYISLPTRKTEGGQLLISPSLDLLNVVTGPKGGKQIFLKKQQDSPHFLENLKPSVQFSSVHSLSHVWLFVTPCIAACQASLSTTNSWSLLHSCRLSQWCHPTISSSVVPFSSCLQSFPASGSFPVSQFFTSGG